MATVPAWKCEWVAGRWWRKSAVRRAICRKNDARMFFGLGPSEEAEQVEIAWPSGIRQVLTGVRAGQVLRVVEPDASAPQEAADEALAQAVPQGGDAEDLEQFWREAPLVLPEKTRAVLPPATPLSELRAATRAQPEVADVHIELGAALARQRAYDEAEAAYRRALQLDADAAQAYVGLGKLYADRGALGQAASALRQAIALDSTLAEPHYVLGNIHLRQQRLARPSRSTSTPSRCRRAISKPISTWPACTPGRPITARP